MYFLIYIVTASAQNQIIQKLELRTNTENFTSKNDKLSFRYTEANQTAQLALFLNKNTEDTLQLQRIDLVSSTDFEIIDSILDKDQHYYFKIKFTDINRSDLLSLSFRFFSEKRKKPYTESISLQPYAATNASIRLNDEEFFIGEERTLIVNSNLPENILPRHQWVSEKGYDYKLTESEGQVRLHVIPTRKGKSIIHPHLRTKHPDMIYDSTHVFVYFSPLEINVKESRLNYLKLSERDLTLNELSKKEGIEVELDNHHFLELNKTYRIENQEEKGGYLIAEIFTKKSIGNGKVLCQIRLYNLHNQEDGYLYIKDGDDVDFITNFSVTPATNISQIQILHKGKNWSSELDLLPGETALIRIQGEGLNKSGFQFKDVVFFENDTIVKDDKNKYFTIQVPVNIASRRIDVYNFNKLTGYSFRIKEHAVPRNFDFIMVNYGAGDKRASSLNKPVLYSSVIQDVILRFEPNRIDADGKLYGEQHFNINIKVTSKKNELIDQLQLKDIVVCPGARSPRSEYYRHGLATIQEINLNNYLRKKTYDLPDWARIEIEILHDNQYYGVKGYTQRIEIIYQRHVEFDVDVSFPTGLLIYKQGQSGIGNFGGISMAMIAQFSFFHPHKIARYRPYKIGAGFLALNAFNFSNSNEVDRDVGLVVIGSIYPIKTGSKLSFPLFVGGGYFLSQSKWFTLVGPGIRIQF